MMTTCEMDRCFCWTEKNTNGYTVYKVGKKSIFCHIKEKPTKKIERKKERKKADKIGIPANSYSNLFVENFFFQRLLMGIQDERINESCRN